MKRTFIQRLELKSVQAVQALSKQAFQRGSFEGGTAPIIGAAFSATQSAQFTTTYLDGNRKVQGNINRRLYRDSHGRIRVEDLFTPAGSTDNPVPSSIAIMDPIAGNQYRLQPQQKIFNTVPWRGVLAIHPPVSAPTPSTRMALPSGYFHGAPESECRIIPLGERLLDGLEVVGTRVECSIPVGAFQNQKPIDISVEQWFSPGLGLIIQTTRRSSMGTEQSNRLEQVVRGEPDPALFVVPPDYTDQVAAALAARGRTPAAINPAYYSEPVEASRLPETPAAPVVRTDFSDQAAWEAIRDEIQQKTPQGFFKASVTFIDDRVLEGLSAGRLLTAVPKNYRHRFMFVVDSITVATPDHPVLVMDLRARAGTAFRAVSSVCYTIENNLSMANMDFDEFARAAARTGVFRGF